MNKNVVLPIMLLSIIFFSLPSCDLFQPLSATGRYEPPEPTVFHEIQKPTPAEEKTTAEYPVLEEPAAKETKGSSLRQELVTYAKQFVGTDYLYAGKKPGGFDCSGFTGYVFGHFDIPLSGSSRYQENDGVKIPVSEVQAGDLLFFRREKNGTVFHVSLVISNDENGLFVVHSTSSRGVVIDNIQANSYWREKHATACRVIQP